MSMLGSQRITLGGMSTSRSLLFCLATKPPSVVGAARSWTVAPMIIFLFSTVTMEVLVCLGCPPIHISTVMTS
uniref:Uncharacterized protein n=1 Tax=Arundo donax TaxID=35708 RepID=A0A0A9CZW0_ARUDO